MTINEINTIFSQIKIYALQPMNEEGLSISTINGVNLFCYFVEDQAKLIFYTCLGRVYTQSLEEKSTNYKKLLQMNLPLFSKSNISLGVSTEDMIYMTTKLDKKYFSKEDIEDQLQIFLQETINYQETIKNIFSKTSKVEQTNSLDMTMFNILKV